MKLPGLLGFLLAASFLCGASDQATTHPTASVSPPQKNGVQSSLLDQEARYRKLLPAEAALPDAKVCLMIRTYIMVRESPQSDVTHRDGYVVCQPAWKFQLRTAVGTVNDR